MILFIKCQKVFYMQPHYFLYFVVTKLSNVMFVFDSVPAVITVSQETLIIYCVIIFAILGLRIMYFIRGDATISSTSW